MVQWLDNGLSMSHSSMLSFGFLVRTNDLGSSFANGDPANHDELIKSRNDRETLFETQSTFYVAVDHDCNDIPETLHSVEVFS
jgi:hypothetical protein